MRLFPPAGRRVCRYVRRLHLPSALPAIRQRQPLHGRSRHGDGSVVAPRSLPGDLEKDCVPTTNLSPSSYCLPQLLLYFDPFAGGRKGELQALLRLSSSSLPNPVPAPRRETHAFTRSPAHRHLQGATRLGPRSEVEEAAPGACVATGRWSLVGSVRLRRSPWQDESPQLDAAQSSASSVAESGHSLPGQTSPPPW